MSNAYYHQQKIWEDEYKEKLRTLPDSEVISKLPNVLVKESIIYTTVLRRSRVFRVVVDYLRSERGYKVEVDHAVERRAFFGRKSTNH